MIGPTEPQGAKVRGITCQGLFWRYRQRALWCDAAEICPSLGFVKCAESRVVLLPPEAPMLRGESKTWHCADGSKWFTNSAIIQMLTERGWLNTNTLSLE